MVGISQGKGGSLASALQNNSPVAGVSLPDVAQPTRAPIFGSFAPSMSSASPPPIAQPVQQQPQQSYAPIRGGYGRKVPENTDFQRINAANSGRPRVVQQAQPVQQYQPPQFSQAALLARQINEEAMRRGRG